MNPGEYPDIHFKLDDGRVVTVDSFVWEPCYNRVITVGHEGESVEKTTARKRLTIENLAAGFKVNYLKPPLINQHPPRIPNSAMTAWLSSAPMSPGALYSFAIVLFFADYVKETSIEAILRRCLFDFDWEAHAEDVSEESNRVWKEVFLDRTLH